MPVMLFIGVIEARQFYVNQKYLASLEWVLLEIIAPPDVEKSPKVAEYIFSALHAIYLPTNWKSRFFKGKVVDWYSFEIVSTNGEPHFYVRTLTGYKTLVETQIFAQYPAAEIKLVEKDYVDDLPPFLPNDQFNFFGADLLFSKPDCYPIRTHPEFEELKGKDEFVRTDPLASIFETLSTLEGGEHIWIQILVRPTGGDWLDKAKPDIDKIMGKEPAPPAPSLPSRLVDLVNQLASSATRSADAVEVKKEEKKDKEPSMVNLSPGKRDLLIAVEKKMAKLAFEANIRFLYFGHPDNFHRGHISGIFGLFRQFAWFNSFKPNGKTMTVSKGYLSQIFPSDKGFFADAIEYKKKWKLFRNYKKRVFAKDQIILNIEELATLYHLPGIGVKAPLFPRVDSKKGQPPSGLPIG